MNDYIFLKLSEMALRAIRAPKGPRWVYFIEYHGSSYFTDRYPFFSVGPQHYFMPGTTVYYIQPEHSGTIILSSGLTVYGTGTVLI